MIYNVFDLGDAKAKDVMVPRVHVTFADVESTYDELLDIFREDKFTRLPVYEETTDNVIGTINMKDLLLFDNTKEFPCPCYHLISDFSALCQYRISPILLPALTGELR